MLKFNEKLDVKNLLSFRGDMTPEQSTLVEKDMLHFLTYRMVNVAGDTIITTYSVKEIDGEILYDMEVLIPVNKKIDCKDTPYKFINELTIPLAVKYEHKGDFDKLDDSFEILRSELAKSEFAPVTSAYNIYVKNEEGNVDEIDIFVGIGEKFGNKEISLNELDELALVGGSDGGFVRTPRATPTIIPITITISKVTAATLTAASAVTYIASCGKGCK